MTKNETVSIDAAFSYRLEGAEFLPTIDLVDAFAREKPELGAEREKIAGGWAFYGGPQSPANHIIGMGLHGPVSKEEFDRVEEFYRKHQSICEVVVSPYADMSLMQHLGARGYRVTEWNSVLIRSISPQESFDAGNLEIRPVSREGAAAWAELVASAWADVTVVPPDLFVPFATGPHAMCFVAHVDGKPAGGAGGSLFPAEGIAALYGAATLPEFRGRGVQNALLQARLRAAADAGCRLAAVCTFPGSVSQRNAERNGFRIAYTKVAMQRQL